MNSEKKYTVLYVDDEEVNLLLFKSTFRRDFNILTANSPKKGLELLESNEVDVVITDQRMPDMTGVDLLRHINTIYNDIPPSRLMVSGYAPDEAINEGFENLKLYRFIPKPWNADLLKQIILESINNK